jgi:hypothetical protein
LSALENADVPLASLSSSSFDRLLAVKKFSREAVGTLAAILERSKAGKHKQSLVPVCLQVYFRMIQAVPGGESGGYL